MLSITNKVSNPTPSRLYTICDKCEAEMKKKFVKDHITRVYGENIHPKERGMTLLDTQKRKRGKGTGGQMDKQTYIQTDRRTYRHTDLQTDRPTKTS